MKNIKSIFLLFLISIIFISIPLSDGRLIEQEVMPEECQKLGITCHGSGEPTNLETIGVILGIIVSLIVLFSFFVILISLTIYIYAKFISKNEKEIYSAKKLFRKAFILIIITLLLYWLIDFIIRNITY